MDINDQRRPGDDPIAADSEESYWRETLRTRPYYNPGSTFEDYAPAYRAGWEAWSRHAASGKRFEDVEGDLRREWEGGGRASLTWERAKLAMRDAWDRVSGRLGATAGAGSAGRGFHPDTGRTSADVVYGETGVPFDSQAVTPAVGSEPVGRMSGATGGTSGATGGMSGASGGGFRTGDGFNYGYSDASPSAGSTMRETTGGRETIRLLNSFLRGEISACETYRQAIMRIGGQYPQLASCLTSHERRVASLKERIRALGGEPATGSGLWGAWAKLVQGTSDLFGERAAIAALESGEDHGLADYRRDLDKLDSATLRWVERELLGEEERTHAALSELKHAHV